MCPFKTRPLTRNPKNVVNSETFKYKNKIIGNTYNVTAGNDELGTKKIE